MSISYNTGASASANNAASCNITIPAGVLTGDVMLLNVQCFTEDAATPSIGFSGGGGGWTLVPVSAGTNPEISQNGTIYNYGFAYYRVATAGDPGATLTVTETGSASGTTWFAMSLVSYTGANTSSPIDTAAGASSLTSTVTCPTLLTATSGDWGVFLGGGGVNGSGGTVPGPAGDTSRANTVSGAGIGAASYDSNGSVGPGGTSIGGGTFATTNSASGFLTAFTIGLAPPGGPAPKPENPAPPQIPHPLWEQLLEVAAYRAAVAPAVASPVPQTWRLMDGVNGRPGVSSAGTQPPASGTSNAGALVNGLSFYVTASGMWFQGYWYYCCASGQSVSPAKFALWSCQSSGAAGTLIPGSVVTSGTLTAGAWNWVPLAQPLQLAIWGEYVAAVGVAASAGYPGTAAQFGAAQPYAAGIVNGPLAAFSDTGGGNPAPGNVGQCPSAAGSDPAVTQPTGALATHDNLWLDVQVSNTAPAGYSGSYRLWPNVADADFNTAADAPVNYVIGTEVILSQASVINAIWYYVPPGQGASGNQWATSADIWNVRTGVRVATQPAPVWLKPFTGGTDGNSNSGRWVYTQLPGTVTLPPGDYYVTVYNGNGSPNGWGAKRLGYWQACGNGGPGAPLGTYQTSPPGAAGITSGPLYAPTTPAASGIADYLQPSQIAPGQSVFAVGPPNQFPDAYVGTPTALFQNYWVDLEVTPAATYQPDAPAPPRIPHPLLNQLLEIAEFRADGGPQPPPTSRTAFAGLATGTGAAQPPVPVAGAAAGLATGTGTAQPPQAAITFTAGLATGTGAAQPPVPAVTVVTGLATGTGAALQPTVSTSGTTTANAGLATGTGAAPGPVITIVPAAGLATGTGAAQPPVPAVTVVTGLATGTGAALQPTVSTSGTTTVFAGVATGTGAALNAAPVVSAGLATGAGTAPAPAIVVVALAGLATGTGAALQPPPIFSIGKLTATTSGAAGVNTAAVSATAAIASGTTP